MSKGKPGGALKKAELYGKYWKSRRQKGGGVAEAPAAMNVLGSEPLQRRSFLKLAGFSMSGALLSACSRAPVEKAIPMLVSPEESIPGRALYYASTCGACPARCGVLVKTVDGRPIKLEGNPEHTLSQGGLCAVGQASVLDVYDSKRLEDPQIRGKAAEWSDVDRQIEERLRTLRASGGSVRFLTSSLPGPTTTALIGQFVDSFDDGNWVIYDPVPCSAIAEAHEQTHGARLLPHYRLDRADVIASFDADFLGTWLSPVSFTADYRKGRRLEQELPALSYHVQFEPRLSLTGCKADRRFTVAPDAIGTLLNRLASRLSIKARRSFSAEESPGLSVDRAEIDRLANRLWSARSAALVLCNSQDVQVQVLCNTINELLGSYGSTIELDRASKTRRGDETELGRFLDELEDGSVDAVFIADSNPVYDLPGFDELLRGVDLVVDFSTRPTETSSLAEFVCPQPHFLESWGDAEAVSGVVSLQQPTVPTFRNTRPLIESLSRWLGEPASSYDLVKKYWQEAIFPRAGGSASFTQFWQHCLHDGIAEVEIEPVKTAPFKAESVRPVDRPENDGYLLVPYEKTAILDGRHSHNAWLQELPDPVSKVSWDNYAVIAPETATELGVLQGDVIRIEESEGGAGSLELPACIQPGIHPQTVAVAVGYGGMVTERFAGVGPEWISRRATLNSLGRVGRSVASYVRTPSGRRRVGPTPVRIAKTGARFDLACTQDHHSIEIPDYFRRTTQVRPVVRETTLEALTAGKELQPEQHRYADKDLWAEDHTYDGHHWGMVVDLEACTGCSACVVACQVENNVPVVGKDEVSRNREMHWIRVDRYYTDSEDGVEAAFQPMFCAQCDHASCETVCPVLATVHSEEGLNQQIYNRCVGTRYCANNCPYKVRRFNWFDYARQDRVENLLLNPNVTVRSRGVMEKCTFCIQRVQEAKIAARSQGTPLADGDIQTACEQSCPAQAIVFGDMNNPESRVARLLASSRRYRVLEELNLRPSVSYLALVKNRPEAGQEEDHG